MDLNSQVHELHPSHAFCIVPDRPIETLIDSYLAATELETNEELCKFNITITSEAHSTFVKLLSIQVSNAHSK
jgi:hypothetical protein